ncbi:diaminopimelate decarboxylase [Candidatus Marinamargulisbacteria bacterium SCGC AG-343-D04]|nr:diaminopimelate decarboxylase [Candidatus Marinamargulisbacteria bacterium SCGC AG-343-D04]
MITKPISFEYIEDKAHLGGHSLLDLVETYKTPLYVLDKDTICHNSKQFLDPLKAHYPNSKVLYAGKANLTLGIAQLITELGLHLDVSSGGELYTAIKAGVPPSNIYFHGNNKTHEELNLAIQHGVTCIIDNKQELENLCHLHKGKNRIEVLIRLKPEIDAHTHKYIRTGQLDSKFGIEKKDCIPFIKEILKHPKLTFKGLHSHIGSQIFDDKPFLELINIMIPIMKEIKETLNIDIQELNCGGGMGIFYSDNDHPLDIQSFIESFCDSFKKECHQHQLALPTLLFEPGRSLIGPAGITLYKIGAIKPIEQIKTYLFVDGGMADNPRPITYGANYSFDTVIKNERPLHHYSIAGKFCESGDILGENIALEACEVGEYILVFGTGAYNYSMASNYNRNCRPAMIMVDQSGITELVRRESYDDLIRLDQML